MIKQAKTILLYCPLKQTVHLSCPALRFCFEVGIVVAPYGLSIYLSTIYRPQYQSNFFCILAVHFFFIYIFQAVFSAPFFFILYTHYTRKQEGTAPFSSKRQNQINLYICTVCISPKTFVYTGICIFMFTHRMKRTQCVVFFPFLFFFAADVWSILWGFLINLLFIYIQSTSLP